MSSKLKVAVLGASTVGKFHVRELLRAGADVTAILGSSPETASKTAATLHTEFGVYPKPYFELERLLENESVDAVSVCTPPHLHYGQIKKCLEAGLHVLCEKPFVLNSNADNLYIANELVRLSEKQGKILTVNTQWPSVLGYIKNLVNLSELESFSMSMQPRGLGIDMLTEQLSHTNSIVVKLIPNGNVKDITFLRNSKKDIHVYFKYNNKNLECDVNYRFTHKIKRPRAVQFSFNDLEFKRKIGENYQQKLVTDTTEFSIEDPFKTSIGKFVGAVIGTCTPLVSKKEIIENSALQDRIVAEYIK